MQLSLLAWRSLPRNSLRGFATIKLGKSLSVKDVAVHCSHGKRWAALPSKPQIDRDGNALKDEKGKVKYVPILEWLDRAVGDDFSNSVIEAIEAQYPGQTDSDYTGA
jgi:hypothetical protein